MDPDDSGNLPDYHDEHRDFSEVADMSGAGDYSEPADHSAGSGKPSAPDMNPVNKYLQNRERAGAQSGLNRMAGGDVAKAENSGGAANPMNFSRSGKGRGRFQFSVKKRVYAGIGGAIIAAIAGLTTLGPGLLLNQVRETLQNKFSTAPKVMARKTKAFFKCALSSACRANVKFVKWNKAAIDSLRGNGAKLKDKSTGKEVTAPEEIADGTDSSPPGDDLEIETPGDSTPVTSDNVETLVRDDPRLAASFEDSTPAADADAATHGDGTYQNVENRDRLSKQSIEKTEAADKVSEADAKKQHETDTGEGTTDPDVVGEGKDISPSAKNKSMLDSVNGGDKAAPSVNKKAAGNEDANADFEAERESTKSDDTKGVSDTLGTTDSSVGDKLKDFGKSLINIFTPLNIMCSLNNGLVTLNKAAKLYKSVQLAGYAMQFMKTESEQRAPGGDGSPGPSGATVARLAGALTTTKTATKDSTYKGADGKTKTIKKGDVTLASATDSFGYKFAAYNDLDRGAYTPYTSSFALTGLTGLLGRVYDKVTGLMNDTVGLIAKAFSYGGVVTDAFNKIIKAKGVKLLTNDGDLTSTVGLCKLFNSPLGQTAESAVSLAIQAALNAASVVSGGAGTAADAALQTSLTAAKEVLITGLKDIIKKTITDMFVGKTALGTAVKIGIFVAGQFAVPALMDWLTDRAVKAIEGKLFDHTLVGSELGDAITAGYGYSEGQNCQLGGCAPMTSGSLGTVLADDASYQRDLSRVAMAADPWNVYDTHTAVGNFVGNFVANIYSNGSQPLGMAQSLLGMFGTAFASFGRTLGGPSLAAATAAEGYTGQCDDPDANRPASDSGQKMALDPFCNQLYSFPSTSDMDIQTVYQQMQPYANDNGSPTDMTNNPYKAFLKGCVNRGAPLGVNEEGETDGGICILGAPIMGVNNTLFYNYVQYQRVADGFSQGSSLGCEADGSCAQDGGSGAGGANGGSTGSVANPKGIATDFLNSCNNHTAINFPDLNSLTTPTMDYFMGKGVPSCSGVIPTQGAVGGIDGTQCVALSVTYWGWNPGGNGQDIVPNLEAAGKAKASPTPVAGGLFSVKASRNWDWGTQQTDSSAGHTGIVLKVDPGKSITTLENGTGQMWVQVHPWSTATEEGASYTEAKP